MDSNYILLHAAIGVFVSIILNLLKFLVVKIEGQAVAERDYPTIVRYRSAPDIKEKM